MLKFIINSWALAVMFSVTPSVKAFGASFSMTTRAGKVFTLETNEDRVTTSTKELMLCGETVASVTRIKLWMPEHGHGSSPVQLGAVQDGCRLAQRVNFTMTGSWEFRVESSDGDSGLFLLDVE